MAYIDYSGDPRSILVHMNENHDPRTGRFTFGKSLHVGKRKYVNPDGSLTDAGQKRYALEIKRNNQKKKENRVNDEADLLDPSRWSQEDTEREKGVVDSAKKLSDTLQSVNRDLPKKNQPNMDLSSMTDAELRQRLARLQTEAAYKNLVASSSQTKTGRDYVDDVLKYAGGALAITSSALGIALAIKQLKG